VGETELALAAGVSRTPARQVIKQLIGENLLVAYSSRGTFVSKIDAQRLEDALLIRRRLEPFLAAKRASDADRAELKAKLEGLLEEHRKALSAGAVERAYQIDAAFHEAICSRDSDSLIWQTIRQARTEADRLHVLSRDRANSLQTALSYHRQIADAIEAGDAEKSFASMDRHLQANEETFAKMLVENPELFWRKN
jgi:DNA-binding GntR family transcriptional regulator